MAKIYAARGAQYVKTAEFVASATDTILLSTGLEGRVDVNGVYEIFNLPAGAVVVGGDLVVETVFNDTTTLTAAVGDVSSASRYLAATSLKAAARTALTITGYVSNGENIRVTIATATGDSTAGKYRVTIAFIMRGMVNEAYTK